MSELAPSRSWLEHAFIRGGVSREDRQRRVYLALMVGVLVPVAVVFAVLSFRDGAPQAGWAITGIAASLTASWGVLRWARSLRGWYRVVLLTVLPFLAWLIHIGNGGGYAFLWAYLLPPAIFYVFGTGEGTFWFALSVLGMVALLALGPGAAYPQAAALRFAMTYVIAGGLALGLQRSRERLFSDLSREKAELEGALEEVRTLTEMIPMCAWCRNVRDDAGYWSRIEDYLTRRSRTVVTHGLCPDCAEKLAGSGGAGMPPSAPDPKPGPKLV